MRLTKLLLSAILSVWFLWICHNKSTHIADHSLRLGLAERFPSSGQCPAIALGPNDDLVACRPIERNCTSAVSSFSLWSYCYVVLINFQRLLTSVYCYYLLSLSVYRLGFLNLLLGRYMTRRHDWIAFVRTLILRHRLGHKTRLRICILFCYAIPLAPILIFGLFRSLQAADGILREFGASKYVVDMECRGPMGGSGQHTFLGSGVSPYLTNDTKKLHNNSRLAFSEHVFQSDVPRDIVPNLLKFSASVPLRSMAPYLTYQQLKKICKMHGEKIPKGASIRLVRQILCDHDCNHRPCGASVSIFDLLPDIMEKRASRARVLKAARRTELRAAKLSKASDALVRKRRLVKQVKKTDKKQRASVSEPVFPPRTPSMQLRHKIISGMCEDIDPTQLEESGCAVCGQLTPTVQLKKSKDVQLNWDVLCNDGVTRKERFHVNDVIEEIPGPILANNCDSICKSCEVRMRKGLAPLHSLSNHLWVGEIPCQLQNLSFAEKMLIAKVRHNRCVVRVASGRGKMSANAIMFATPVVKLYNVLPPSQDEVSEVLAFVFLGPAKPTDQDYVRTPMLVRRQRVKDALDWLKLNHADYADLNISQENLNSLPEAGIPCGVDWKPVEEDESNNIAAAVSVHDQGDEQGTESGPCSFSVAGITGEEYGLADIKTLKAKALEHLKRGGDVLGVGQSNEAQSLFNNVQLYPQMFPWLFPYGKGGIGNPLHKRRLSEKMHKRLLLMYHDKRFQTDFYFPMIAFNDIQIKSGSSGSYLMAKRKIFKSVVERLMNIDSAVLSDLASRLERGEHIKTKTDSEQLCFDLLNDLEHVGGHVQGSLTAKKYMRNEVWSLISFKGAPTWFITFSPVDNNHPLCLYYADNKLEFSPALRSSDGRLRLISQNPVAAARFFHHMTQSFIKHILGVGTDHSGLYGDTDAYYGTVEQQGRLTLHMHMLIWIKGALSPQEIRDRVLDPDGLFQKSMISYLEACHVGEFLTGTLAEVKAKVPYHNKTRHGMHEVIFDELQKSVPSLYQDPTQTLPAAPPPLCENCNKADCVSCNDLAKWWTEYNETVDDLILRSNVHTCRRPVAGTDLTQPLKPGARVKNEVKGCIRKDGTCAARFPRDLSAKTEVNPEDGSITMKKLEPMINCVTPEVTYSLRCNTDVTSLLSGTSIKAVVAYISDYVTKASLKLYHIFDTVGAVLNRKTVGVGGTLKNRENARVIIMQMVNSLTSKLQIGSPMASLYLLGNPDRYTNLQFKPFWWRSYVLEVKRSWPVLDDLRGCPVESKLTEEDEDSDYEDETNKVFLMKTNEAYLGLSNVDDYLYRPSVFDDTCLYDYFQMTERRKRTKKEMIAFVQRRVDEASVIDDQAGVSPNVTIADESIDSAIDEDAHEELVGNMSDNVSMHDFAPSHPLFKTHYLRCNRRNLEHLVPNFVGGCFPRMDQGDREFYCCTMLTLFKPWRVGKDLKNDIDNWHETFTDYEFTSKARKLMGNFNLKYECHDARDDFFHQSKHTKAAMPSFNCQDEYGEGVNEDDVGEHGEKDLLDQVESSDTFGPKHIARLEQMRRIEDTMTSSGWLTCKFSPDKVTDRYVPQKRFAGTQWKLKVKQAREAILEAKYNRAPSQLKKKKIAKDPGFVNDVSILDSYYFTKYFKAKNLTAQKLVRQVCTDFTLNEEQMRAFNIIANHAIADEPAPLRMYLGGVGGTGKSRVIEALQQFFIERGEAHRFLVLAPTGTAAALLNGSTYHSVLGISDSSDGGERIEGIGIKKVQEKLRGVDYIFLDEVSMVSCSAMYSISAKLALALSEPNEAFGGMNMIFAGDFAQLPPVCANPLYCPESSVSCAISARATVVNQKNSIGKLIWRQVTTAVILKQIMRLSSSSPDDIRLRTALGNMRYGACTAEDIAYLESRTVSRRPGHPNFTDSKLRNVSVITGLNAQKDKINELGSRRFAQETNQDLTDFYSNDLLCAGSEERRPKQLKKRSSLKLSRQIPNTLQSELWDAWPCSTSDHIPGKLSLCIGLPIMIRNNDATELCMTKGQEGIVVGWQEGIGNNDQRILDTLFVRLVDPPKQVCIPDLASNIVALTRGTSKTWCALNDDRIIQISREQVFVLPNFAMTDYASQGKSREFNVVDLNNCKNHFSYYTALSRSKSSNGTVILQGMSPAKITKGIPGWLRQEFRELEMLSEITELRYHNLLPASVKGISRHELLSTYRQWKGVKYEPLGLHDAIRRRADDDDTFVSTEASTGSWQLVGSDRPKKNDLPIKTKRKACKSLDTQPPKKKSRTEGSTPAGLVWDSINYSCAYDALFSPIYNIWVDHVTSWTARLQTMGPFSGMLATEFLSVATGSRKFEVARDNVRRVLTNRYPNRFPVGRQLTSIDELANIVFGHVDWAIKTLRCTKCDVVQSVTPSFPGMLTIVPNHQLRSRLKRDYSISHWLKNYTIVNANRTCPCGNGLVYITKLVKPLPCIYLSLTDKSIMINATLNLTINNEVVCYALRGVIYLEGEHFTSRIINCDGDVWYHDGIETGNTTVFECSIHDKHPHFLNTCLRGETPKNVVGVLYAQI